METKWIDEQAEPLSVGDAGFLVRNSYENTGGERYELRDTPAHTNQSHMPRLVGWCGSWNNVSTYGEGVWKVIRVAKNGRLLLQEIEGAERQAFLDEYGYPDLTPED